MPRKLTVCIQVAPMLKPEAAVKLWSCVYDIPESDFNAEATVVPPNKPKTKTADDQVKTIKEKAAA